MCVRRLLTVLAVGSLLLGATSATVGAQYDGPEEDVVREKTGKDDDVTITENEITLVEIELKGRTITGRLILETENIIKVKVLGAGEIGYSKKLINNVKRRTVTRDVYYEMVGDYYANKTWDFKNDVEDFIQARKNYARALLYAKAPERKAELRDKYESIKREREEWQRESMKQEELEKVEKQTEAAQFEKELTRQKLQNLESVQAYRQRIFQLEDAVGQLSREVQRLRSLVFELEDELSDLESVYYRYGRGYYYYPYYPRWRDNDDGDRWNDRRNRSGRRGNRRNSAGNETSPGDQQPSEGQQQEEEEEDESPFGWQPKPW